MSKESYVRGFCKAAEAHGIDPVALAKFAQWAPKDVARFGSKKSIPSYSSTYDVGGNIRSPRDLLGNIWMAKNHEEVAKGRAAVDDKFKNWWVAHTNALEQAIKPLRPVISETEHSDELLDSQNSGLMESLAKIYHDSMAKSTGAVSRVSAPISKK